MAALERLQVLVRSQRATSEADRIRQELRALLAALYTAQPAIEASAAALKAAKLAAMLAFVQHRIEAIVANELSPLPAEVAALITPVEPAAEAVRNHLAIVPRAEEPELPIPAPAPSEAPAIALVQPRPASEPVQPLTSVIIDCAVPPPAAAEPVPEPVTPAPVTVEFAPELMIEAELEATAPPPVAVEPAPELVAPPPVAVEPAPARRTAATMPVVDFLPAPRAIVVAPEPAPAAPAATEVATAETVAVDTIAVESMVAAAELTDAVETDDVVAITTVTTVAIIEPPETIAPAPIVGAPSPLQVRIIPAEAGLQGSSLDLEDFGAGPAPEAVLVEAIASAPIVVVASPPQPEPVVLMPDDPLALIMALSEAERIAMFT